jgi:hypothetical protein
MAACDVLLCGTGSFAARIAFDLAATTRSPMRVIIVGRNTARLDWLVTASNARAKIFDKPIRFLGYVADLLATGGAERMIDDIRPPLVVQAASAQTSSVIAQSDNRWAHFVRKGGLSATALAQTAVSLRVAEAMTISGQGGALINCSFPDVVNEIIAAAGHRVLCGFGNVAILSNVFAAKLEMETSRIKVLSHYQNLAAFRAPAAERSGRTARVWIDDVEVADVFAKFSSVKLTPEPVIDISGATGVPVIQALVEGHEWLGHLPGPNGLPGGYPVRVHDRQIELDLPAALDEQEAIDWNRSFEQMNGLIVCRRGIIQFTGRLAELLNEQNAAIKKGFHVSEFNEAFAELQAIRARLEVS